MESTNTKEYNKIRIEYKDIGFFHGYYLWKGYTALFKFPDWFGKIFKYFDKSKGDKRI